MIVSQLFLQRYDALYAFWIGGLWDVVTDAQMRARPHPRLNSIAWNLWHLTRVEDAGMNRFVVDGRQVFDEAPWAERLNLPWRHNGSEMSFAEVDELNQRIDVQALHDYSDAVQQRTRERISQLDEASLAEKLATETLRVILFDEGLAHPNAAGLLENYTGWSKGKFLMNFAMTHPYQHIGEIGVIASLLDINFD